MKTLKRRSKPISDYNETELSPQALKNTDVAKLNKKENAPKIETGYFDFNTGKIIFDK